MLQAIRDRASGWLAYLIVFLISIPFALWGVNEYLGGGQQLVAAEVDGEEIPVQEFNSQYQQQRQRIRSMFGGNVPPGFLDDDSIKEGVIKDMVRRVVARREANTAGYGVGPTVLLEEIKGLGAFQNNGRFDAERYEQVLRSQRQTKQRFEDRLRQSLDLTHFENGIRTTSFLPPTQRKAYLQLKNQTRELTWLTIKADSYKEEVGIDDAAVSAYYESETDRFNAPEQVKLEYILLDQGALAAEVEASEDDLRNLYEEQADRFITPEERAARHLLVKVVEGADDEAVEAARQRAEELRQRLRDGEEFADLAQASDDELSAESGGDLGYIARGDMDPVFENALFALEEGAISDVVRTAIGFQIVQHTATKAQQQKTFEEAREEIEAEYQQRVAENRFVEQAEQLVTLSFEQADSLAPAADASGAKIETTDWVSRETTQGIAAEAAVKEAMFSTDVLGERRNSDLIELEDARVLVLRVTAHEPAKPKPLDAVRDEVVRILTVERTTALAKKAGEEALEQLRMGKAPEDVAASLGVQLQSPGFVARDDSSLPGPVVSAIFSANKPRGGEPVYAGVDLPAGDYAVVVLTGAKDGEVGEDEQITALQAQQDNTYGARELEAAYSALEAGAEVNILRDNL